MTPDTPASDSQRVAEEQSSILRVLFIELCGRKLKIMCLFETIKSSLFLLKPSLLQIGVDLPKKILHCLKQSFITQIKKIKGSIRKLIELEVYRNDFSHPGTILSAEMRYRSTPIVIMS